MDKKFVPIGRIVATQGLKGDLRLFPYFEEGLKYFKDIERVRLRKREDEEAQEYPLRGLRTHGKFLVIGLAGCDDIDEAREMVGMEVLIEEGKLADLPENEFYWHQVAGLAVHTTDGRYLGKVEDNFSPLGSNQVLVVRDGGNELLIPALKSLVAKVDLEEGKLIINPMEGLLEDNEI